MTENTPYSGVDIDGTDFSFLLKTVNESAAPCVAILNLREPVRCRKPGPLHLAARLGGH
jgi:hypothetical protein